VVIATITSTIPSSTTGAGRSLTGGGFGGGVASVAVVGLAPEADVTAEIIRLVDVSKVYGSGDATVHAVDHVSLAVHEGDFLAVMVHRDPVSRRSCTYSDASMCQPAASICSPARTSAP